MDPALAYLDAAEAILKRIREHEMEHIERAAEICAHTIANDGLVHMFATGHSRMMIEEMYPRHGSFPGFHPIVELSLTYHNQVVGANGQRQAMFLEHVEGFAPVILRNFVLQPPDSFLIFSNSGVNEVVVEMALEAKKRDLSVIAVISKDHSRLQAPKHSSGKKLIDLADVTIDNCTPAGDAMVRVEGLDDPVGPGSTIGGAAVTNALKCAIAQRLVALGKPPLVLTSSVFAGAEKSQQGFEDSYDDYQRRLKRVYGG
ncbi:MAG TPA: SIS domain-containing protein [Aggregatilinea sp.]|uniref:SIS domain-containing protein n=1 Tax=Aggregatilinea sp. TaxID=2806333 RepID=UPI002C4E9E28|nr:SIS domain-containing protein [Aggregatilinea sp.]HML22010.1 SIS domain-containing protein [Aggregatilinea sp.]